MITARQAKAKLEETILSDKIIEQEIEIAIEKAIANHKGFTVYSCKTLEEAKVFRAKYEELGYKTNLKALAYDTYMLELEWYKPSND